MKAKALLLSLLILFTLHSASALSLDQAKTSGVFGESPSGYIELVVEHPTPEAIRLMQDVNSQRRAQYEAIAKKNGTPLQAVELLAGKKAVEKTAPGNYVKLNGQWVRK